jgi:hypothetical protein
MSQALTLRGLVSAFFLSVLLVPIGLWLSGVPSPVAAGAAAAPPSLAVIQTMSELATTRVHISDVIEGATRDFRGKWSVHGEAILGVNLAEAVYLHTQPEKREAVLRLPQPHLISSKVDHQRSDELYIHWVSWVPFRSKQVLRAEVWRQADAKVSRLADEPRYKERAKVQAERVLAELYSGLGWKVRIAWDGQELATGPDSGSLASTASPGKE